MAIERTESFTRSAADVWAALREAPAAIKSLTVKSTDDANRAITISGGMSAMTWGQNIQGTVTARGDTCELQLIGKPKLWSAMANKRIKELHQEIIDAIQTRLARTPNP